MKKFIAMLLIIATLAACTVALAENVKFTSNSYVYKKAGSGKTETIIARGSVAEKLSTSKNGKWIKVELSDGSSGWVKKSTTAKTSKSAKMTYASGGKKKSEATSKKQTGVKGSYVKATGNVNIRDGASLSSKVLGTLKKGKTLKFKGEIRTDSRGVDFYKVSYNGKTAWVSSGYSELKK